MFNTKLRVNPKDQSNCEGLLPVPSWARFETRGKPSTPLMLCETENMNKPKHELNCRPQSKSSNDSNNDLEITKSLPELNRGRRINETMAPYERFLIETQREMARSRKGSEEAIEKTENENNVCSGDEVDTSLDDAHEEVKIACLSTADDETSGENKTDDEVKTSNKQQEIPKNSKRSENKPFLLLPLDIPSFNEQNNSFNKLNFFKNPPKRRTGLTAVEIASTLSNTTKASSEGSNNKRRELEGDECKNISVQTERDTEKMANAENKNELKGNEKEIKETEEKSEKNGSVSRKSEDDAGKKSKFYGKISVVTSTVVDSNTSDIFLKHSETRFDVPSLNTDVQSNSSSRLPTQEIKKSPDQILLEYFKKLTASDDLDATIDFDYIQSLLSKGANVNMADNHGETILHEVSVYWSVDAAQFFINHGADINAKDNFGRSPLHAAAAADYVEMVTFLITCGADIGAKTTGEEQTPLHYAAKHGAVNCVKYLMAKGADLDSRDFKGRTALQVAAEHMQSLTTRVLLEEGAPAGVTDDSGMSALVPMIQTMPGVAMKALDQFYTVDRLKQKERYYLNFLDKSYGSDITLKQSRAPSPLEAVVDQNRLELIMHPTFKRLIQVKWNYFGRTRAWIQLLINVFLAVVVTTLAVLHPNDVSTYYTPLTQYWWRIALESFALLLTFNEIRNEIRDYIQSRNDHHLWKKWKVANLQREVQFCHPNWPQEKKFIESLILSARVKGRRYFHDKSNFVDWSAYFMLLVAFILHYMNISVHYLYTSKLVDTQNNTQHLDHHLVLLGKTSKELNQIYLPFISFALIVIWIRLLKYCRPFQITGPFVVILSHMITASLKWSFVFAAFYIPYTASFWIMFGGNTERPVEGYNRVDSLLFNVLQITLVGDYNFSELAQVAPITARILCGSFLFIAAIVLLNLFIALMSDTFQRVHDNAQATAAIERAHFIQSLESEASNTTQQRFRKFLLLKCSPDEVDLNRQSVEDKKDRIHDRLSKLEEQMIELKELLLERTLNTKENSTVDMMNNRLSNIESVLKHVQGSDTYLSNPRTIFTAWYKRKPHDSELPTETRERGQRRNSSKASKETKKKQDEVKITGKQKKFRKGKQHITKHSC